MYLFTMISSAKEEVTLCTMNFLKTSINICIYCYLNMFSFSSAKSTQNLHKNYQLNFCFFYHQ